MTDAAAAPADTGGGGDAGGDTGGGGGSEGDSRTGDGATTIDDRNTRGGRPTGNEGNEGDEGEPGAGEKKPAAKTEAKKKDAEPAVAAKYKGKRGGKDFEMSGEELVALLGDEHEHAFTGPGGKEMKLTYPELIRRAQLAEGAQSRIERASKQEKEHQAALAWARKPENIGAYLESHLGITNHEDWAMEIATTKFNRQQELLALQKDNPHEYQRKMEEDVSARFERKQKYEKEQTDRRGMLDRRKTAHKEAQDAAKESFKEAGIPWNSVTRGMAQKIAKEFLDADIELPDADVAREVRKLYRAQRRGELEGMEDDDIVDLFGDGFRTRLRELESNLAKGKKKKDKETKSAGGDGETKPKEDEHLTESEFKRLQRRGEL